MAATDLVGGIVAISGDNLFFFLGGHDLEMLAIRELLDEYAPGRYCDRGLTWGATASVYQTEIQAALDAGQTPVLVELEDDLGLGTGKIITDHHGHLSGSDKPTSLHQVFDLLGLPGNAWTRRMDLVAANDRGHIRGLLDAGATMDEIIAIRVADRRSQGITGEQELQAVNAIAARQEFCGGRLTLVELPHNRAATVADRLAVELGGPGYENLLIVSPAEVNFYGIGALILALDKKFIGGWYGGSLPERGFWGHGVPVPDILQFIVERLHATT